VAGLGRNLHSPVQGTGADIIKRALCLIYDKLDKIESKLIACIHDEIILETPENRKQDAARILKETMIEAGEYYLKKVPVEVEVSTGSSWAD
jgi:DNA polymerase I-like protein with 3'-5' exonuclease and polymerase domains